MLMEEWRLTVASAIGTSHIASKLPCQDHAQCWLLDGDHSEALVAVICDGAGSAAHSQIGARLAAETFAGRVQEHLASNCGIADITAELARSWILSVGDALEQRARDEGHATRDYACTLLAVIAGAEETAFIQVGDGAIVVSHGEEDGWSYVFWPQHGEFANTTNFVVSHNVVDVLAFELAPRRINEFALFSDGIENLVLNQSTKSVHEAFFEKMMQPVRNSSAKGVDEQLSVALATYLSSKVICSRTDDDKSLILATRLPQASEAAP